MCTPCVLTVYSSQRGGRLADGRKRSVPVRIRPLGSYYVSDWLLRQTGAVCHLRHFDLRLQDKHVTATKLLILNGNNHVDGFHIMQSMMYDV